ncbi:MAG: hypothetical protein CMB80_19030 [Flammeovirgaceae bacterium]|nr:hypothetical protein [Flammeovirgaceae bacterium]MBE63347.1 hypothetical protein [Flammeovirgaceae bacterium]MBR07741.1 hypothetical protein [Rickettsiales bacterium]|tara:strand:- start:99 stop:704 length:606 start_codon:yes stop_codon:yes gene_type:complete
MKYLILLTILGASLSLKGQFVDDYKINKEDKYSSINKRPIYLNFSAGLDNHVGLFGIGFSIPVADQFGIRTGIGLGGWGLKYNLGVKAMEFGKDGWGFGLGYSYCPGIRDFEVTFTSQNNTANSFNLDLLPVGSINLTLNKNWVLGETNILYLESGYAFKTGGPEIYRVNSGGTLNSSDEYILEILRPGGIILAIGFQIGL